MSSNNMLQPERPPKRRKSLYWAYLSKNPGILDAVLIAILPLVIISLNPVMTFGNGHHADAWFYFGHFHLFDQRSALPVASYRLDRIPAILPGYLLYKFLPPMAAHYSWFLFHYYLVVYSLYYAARLSFGRPAALMAAIFLGTNKLLLGYFSTNYVGVAAVAFGFLSIAMVTKAGHTDRSTSKYFLIFSGMALTAAAAAHLKVLLYLFVIPLYYLLCANIFSPKFWKQREIIPLIFYFVLGIFLCTILLGVINYFGFDGRFSVFSATIKRAPRVFEREAITHYRTFYEWYAKSGGVQFGLVTLICSLYYVFRKYFKHSRDISSDKALVYTTCFLYIAVAVLSYKLSGHAVMRYNKYAMLLAPAYMALLATVFARVPGKSNIQFWILALCAAALGVFASYLKDPVWIVSSFKSYGNKAIFIVILAGVAIAVLAGNKRFPKMGVIGALLVLMIVQAGLSADNYGYHPFKRYKKQTWAKEQYTRAHNGMAFLRDLHLTQRPLFWIAGDRDADYFLYSRSFQNTRYLRDFPRLELEELKKYRQRLYKAGDIVVIMDNEEDIIGRANETLSKFQLAVSPIVSKVISHAGVTYEMVVTQVESLSLLSK